MVDYFETGPEAEQFISEWRQDLGSILARSLPMVDPNGTIERIRTTERTVESLGTHAITVTSMVSIRKAHQTRLAATSVRTASQAGSERAASTQSARKTIIAKMQSVLHSREDQRGVGTGLERAIRTQNKTVGSTASPSESSAGAGGSDDAKKAPTLSGNAANAALASSVRGNNVSLAMFFPHQWNRY